MSSSIQKDRMEWPNLNSDSTDKVIALFRGLLGLAPGIGPLAAEFFGLVSVQRQDRIAAFCNALFGEFQEIKDEQLKQKARGENFIDLLEDAAWSAAKTNTEERRQYIVALLIHSLTNDQLSHIEEKKLLSLLGELNDAEIIILQKFAFDAIHGKNILTEETRLFYEKHSHIFFAGEVGRAWTSSDKERKKAAFYSVYENNLRRIGLLQVDSTVRDPKAYRMSSSSNMAVIEDIRISPIGLQLLQYIDILPKREA